MPIGPPSLGGSGGLGLPLPPRYQPHSNLPPIPTDVGGSSSLQQGSVLQHPGPGGVSSVGRQQQPLPHQQPSSVSSHVSTGGGVGPQTITTTSPANNVVHRNNNNQLASAHPGGLPGIGVSSGHPSSIPSSATAPELSASVRRSQPDASADIATLSSALGSPLSPVGAGPGMAVPSTGLPLSDSVSSRLSRPSRCIHGRPLGSAAAAAGSSCMQSCTKKYVLLCGACGMCSILLGSLYLVIYLLLRSYTSSLQYFETMPTYVPAIVQILTGLLVVGFVRRKHRVSILVKLCGCLCLVCSVLCVIVTVTTTVLHMNRLQTLHECEYIPHAESCTCTTYTGIYEPGQEAVRYVFFHVSSCDVIHGPLYACLRAIFGLSVIGILVSIFSCMLVYQLLSHEKKKMYWEQLESRRRLLYPRPYPLPSTAPAEGGPDTEGGGPAECGCCSDDYGFPSHSTQESLYPYTLWDTVDDRYWSSGLIGADADAQLPNGGPRSLLLHLHHPAYSRSGLEDGNPQHGPHSGVLLRPYLHRGLESRLGGVRRPPHHHANRPLSDPGLALHLPPYPPPPFPEAFLPVGYPPDAFPGYLWGPPPPYSQPTSTENIPTVTGMTSNRNGPGSPNHPVETSTSPTHLHNHDGTAVIMSPLRRPPTLADLMRGSSCDSPNVRGLTSPTEQQQNMINSPSRIISRASRSRHIKRSTEDVVSGIPVSVDQSVDRTNSLPLRHKSRRLPLGHVKSLGDVTEDKNDESLDVIFCDGKEITSLDKIHGEIIERKPISKHLKSVSDPKSVYSVGKMEPESEIYFADVSSCISLRPEGEEVMYYSDPTCSGSQQYSQQLYQDPSSQTYLQNLSSSISSSHMYEQVREDEDEGELDSHHTSDDTMIVHTSSSDQSVTGDPEEGETGAETENTYSIISPDRSSVSPMVTDTDAYSSCYTPISPNNNINNNRQTVTQTTAKSDAQSLLPQYPLTNDNTNPTIISSSKTPSTNRSSSMMNENVVKGYRQVPPSVDPSSLHHPLYPVRPHQHQAYHHQLGQGYDTNNSGKELNKNAKQDHIPTKKLSHGKRSSKKSHRKEIEEEHKYESVEAPPIELKSNFKDVNKTPEPHLTSSVPPLSTKSSNSHRQPRSHGVSLSGRGIQQSSHSPSKHKSRQHKHHHNHHHNHHHTSSSSSSPRHRSVQQQQQASSSSSSLSSLSSPTVPKPLLPQDVPSDLNGNVHHSSPPSYSVDTRTAAPASSIGQVRETSPNDPNLAIVSRTDTSKDQIVSSPSKKSPTCSSTSTPTKSNSSSTTASPSKKQKSNLSLPLQKLVTSPKIEKCSSAVAIKSKTSSSPQKSKQALVSSKPGDGPGGDGATLGAQRRKSDHTNKAKHDSRRRQSKDTGLVRAAVTEDGKHEVRKSEATECRTPVKRSRKTAKVAEKNLDPKAESFEISGESSSPEKTSTSNKTVTDNLQSSEQQSRRTPNVHQLLQTLKSVNV